MKPLPLSTPCGPASDEVVAPIVGGFSVPPFPTSGFANEI